MDINMIWIENQKTKIDRAQARNFRILLSTGAKTIMFTTLKR